MTCGAAARSPDLARAGQAVSNIHQPTAAPRLVHALTYTDPFGLCVKQEKGNATQSNVCASDITGRLPSRVSQIAGATADFRRNYQDMRRANTIRADKYFHAKANCEAAQRGPEGEETAAAISNSREWADQNLKGDPEAASDEDQKANHLGRSLGAAHPTGSCSEMVAPLRPNGLSPEF